MRETASGRGQAGENRHRDVALIGDAEHDVHDHDRDDEQHGEIRQRVLERFRGSLELTLAPSGSELTVAARTRLRTSPSEAPGARPNEIVTRDEQKGRLTKSVAPSPRSRVL